MDTFKKLPVSKLIVNPSNDRFPSVDSELQEIEMMIVQFGGEIYNLAKDICNRGLSPKPLLVVPKDDKYLVKDGNRRTTAIKLMLHPSLIGKNHPEIKRKFNAIRKEFKKNPIKTIRCYVTDNDDADEWIKLEHTGKQNGVGINSWNSEQIKRYEMRHGKKKDLIIQVYDYINESKLINDDTKNLLPAVKLTNMERLLSDKDVRQKMGLQYENGIITSIAKDVALSKALTKIIEDFSNPDFKVKEIYVKSDRKSYMESISEYLPKEEDVDEEISWPIAEKMSDTEQKTKSKSTDITTEKPINNGRRNTLIPNSCIINIENPRICSIFNDELKKMNIKRYPNSISVMLRVFIELSCDYFLDNHKHLLKSMNQNNITANDAGDLIQKIQKINQYLLDKKIINKAISKGVKLLKSNNETNSVDTLNSYVHNLRVAPKVEDLLSTWDSIQDFMLYLWNNIKSEEEKE